MSSRSKEAATLRAMVRSSNRFQSEQQREAVADELTEFINCARISPLRRRRLLQFIHTSRALETSLLSICQARGIAAAQVPSMNAYLGQLANCTPAALPQVVRELCSTRVAAIRNRLAHGAGAYPAGDLQLNSGFDAVRTCLAVLLS